MNDTVLLWVVAHYTVVRRCAARRHDQCRPVRCGPNCSGAHHNHHRHHNQDHHDNKDNKDDYHDNKDDKDDYHDNKDNKDDRSRYSCCGY